MGNKQRLKATVQLELCYLITVTGMWWDDQTAGVVILVDINYLEWISKKGRDGARRVALYVKKKKIN